VTIDWHWASIPELAAAFRDGRSSPTAHLSHLLGRIDALEPSLHAFVALDSDGAAGAADASAARFAAGQPLGPLDGIPIAIKDVIDVAGFPTTCHSALRLDHVAARDADVVARLRAAGAIILGKLSTHEFAIGGPAFDLPFPPARNPWNTAYHPGGSSSGAGAGVAAGFFSAAIGTDTAGSARNPASASGGVGLKPTYERLSRDGVFPLAPTLDHVGILTRGVEDAAILFDVLTGDTHAADLGSGASGLRIGMVRHFHEEDMPADAETAAALDRVAVSLAAQGAEVIDMRLPPLEAFATVNRVLLQSEGYAIHGADMRTRPERFSALTRKALLPGAFLSAKDMILATWHRGRLTEAVDAAFADVDVLLTASSMEPACAIDDPAEIARTYMLQARTPFNVTGHPALAMMAGLSTGGLPLSLQSAPRRDDERTLLRVAAAWEAAMGGPQHPPL